MSTFADGKKWLLLPGEYKGGEMMKRSNETNNHHGGSSRSETSGGKGGNRSFCFDSCMSAFFEYETPKVVTVQNVPLGILRLFLQIMVISFVVFYQLWYAKGYQEFAEVEASVTTKVKGFSR